MNPLHEAIKEKIVQPMLKERLHTLRGKIVAYDNKLNRANVEIDNPYGVGKRTLEHVPLQIGSGGVHSAGPFVGDDVWVAFVDGNILNPKIIVLADEQYEHNTRQRMQHRRKGAFLPDSI